jgi:hypothetical protein
MKSTANVEIRKVVSKGDIVATSIPANTPPEVLALFEKYRFKK